MDSSFTRLDSASARRPGNLFQVDTAPYALGYTLQDLLVDAFVNGVVFFGDVDQLAIAYNVNKRTDRLQALLLSGSQVFEVAGSAGIVQLFYLIRGNEAGKQVLAQGQIVTMAG